jgi:hypothetical protein
MRRWIVPEVALALVIAVGSAAYAQTPSGGDSKMDKDKMMDKKDGKMMDKMDKNKMMQKKDDMKMQKKDDSKMMDKMDKDKMMDKKQ